MKEAKQAEFLVLNRFPWTLVSEIGALQSRVADAAAALLQSATHRPTVSVRPEWYY